MRKDSRQRTTVVAVLYRCDTDAKQKGGTREKQHEVQHQCTTSAVPS
jgi:hypothetical protein